MKKERKELPLKGLQLNSGQLAWLPKNPRQWTQADIDRTAASITEDPDFLEDRPLLVTPKEGGSKWIVFAGNLRHEGCKAAGKDRVPCVVYCPESEEDFETIKRRAMKDNGSFGAWDFDALANEWDDLPLTDWGIPTWGSVTRDDIEKEIDGMIVEQGSAPGESETGLRSFTFVFTQEEGADVQAYIEQRSKEKLQAQILEICRNAEAK